MTLFWLNKADKDIWLPRMFDLYYENMSRFAPSGLAYEAERQEWLSNVSPALDKAPRRALLALDGDALAGFVMFYTRGDLLMVEEFQLRREFQGGLLFLRLCRKLLSELPGEVRAVEAYAHRRNDRSVSLMRRLGMRPVPEEDPRFVHLRGDAANLRLALAFHPER